MVLFQLSLEDLRANWVHLGAISGHLPKMATLGGLEGCLGHPWGNLGLSWGHVGAGLGELGGYLGPRSFLLKCKIRFRSAPVQRKRLHDNTQVHAEKRKTWKSLIFVCFISFFEH